MKILLIVFLAISGIIAVRQRRSRGGVPISIKKVKFFMSIRRDTKHICGGALISPKHVLTAAHCVLNEQLLPVSNLVVVSDASDRLAPGIPHQIGYIMYPPTFNRRSQFHDLAVLLLSEFDDLNNRVIIKVSNVKPVNAAVARYWAYDHRELRYGRSHLHKMNFLVYSIDLCPIDNADEDSLNSDMFCGGKTGGAKLNNTDLGGPLVQGDKVIGVASWINENYGEPYFRYVYMLSDFINEAKKCVDSSCASPTCAVHPYNEYLLFDED